jgi:hypothetical protein
MDVEFDRILIQRILKSNGYLEHWNIDRFNCSAVDISSYSPVFHLLSLIGEGV